MGDLWIEAEIFGEAVNGIKRVGADVVFHAFHIMRDDLRRNAQ